MKIFFAALGFLACLATPTVAITYSEVLDGELSGQNIGTLDIGTNTISGIETLNAATLGNDIFSFSVATGTKITGVTYQFQPTFNNTGLASNAFLFNNGIGPAFIFSALTHRATRCLPTRLHPS